MDEVLNLRQTSTTRARAQALLARARAGGSPHFRVDDSAIAGAAQWVAKTTLARYTNGHIPYHSRWRHFEAGGVGRLAGLNAKLPADKAARAVAQIDLAVVSVLLDAGAGAAWSYDEAGQKFTRSEGLGVASFHGFCAALFSSEAGVLQADAAGLQAVTEQSLGGMFQVNDANPIVGLPGRVSLMNHLGRVLAERADVFADAHGVCRPGNLFLKLGQGREVQAHAILDVLLDGLSDVWRTPNHLGGVSLGDCWPHSAVGWMPFHKLSQWLTYSLLEPFEWAGVAVTGLGALTGLPEYRNGGLLLDAGVLRCKNPDAHAKTWAVGDEFIVEWRALTVALLDEIAVFVRQILGKTEAEMPLACVLEGGTWAAGRVLAQQLRGGEPPLKLALDGTVF